MLDGSGVDARADRKRSRFAVHRLGIVEIALQHGEATSGIPELNGALGRRDFAGHADRLERARVRRVEIAAVELEDGERVEPRSGLDRKPCLDRIENGATEVALHELRAAGHGARVDVDGQELDPLSHRSSVGRLDSCESPMSASRTASSFANIRQALLCPADRAARTAIFHRHPAWRGARSRSLSRFRCRSKPSRARWRDGRRAGSVRSIFGRHPLVTCRVRSRSSARRRTLV